MSVLEAFNVARWLAVSFALAWAGWWVVLCLVALRAPRSSGAGPLRPYRWAVIVPAHNEEASVGATIDSVRRAAAELPHSPLILVVADNCTDRTAEIASWHGATVLSRDDPSRRGKGYALEYAISHLRTSAAPDAVAFVDADSVVNVPFLRELQQRLEGGAQAVQSYYGVAGTASDLTALRRIAFAILHWSRPLGASRMRLGTGLKGNGMALTWQAASEGLGSTGLAEDAAMTLALARRGVKVDFAPLARVHGYMAGSYQGASVQDDRWERGRLGLFTQAIKTSLVAARRGRIATAAGALDVASPPLSALAVGTALLAVSYLVVPGPGAAFAFGGVGAVVLYVITGLAAARVPWRDVMALRMAPRFVLYKLGVLLRAARPGHGRDAWQRTSRTGLGQ